MILDNTNIINNDRDKTYIDLRYFMSNASRVYIIIISWSLTAKKIIMLNAIEVVDIKPLKIIELF